MRILFAVATSLCLGSAAAAPASITVEAGDWGAASVHDIQAVLDSVAEVVLRDLSGQGPRIVVRASAAGPRVLAEKSVRGEHQVLLNVRDTRWDQFAYQFSHELCHVASNYDQRPVDGTREHQWFEEAVCEAVSIVALQRLAVQWQERAPHPGWASYAPAFGAYAQRLLAAEHRHVPGRTLAAWYGENAPQIERNPYVREKNDVIAGRLVELFQRDGLQALAYLNVQSGVGPSFEAYLGAWYDCCPQAHRALVGRVIEIFRT